MLFEFKADAVLRVCTTMSRVATVVTTSDEVMQNIAQTTGQHVPGNAREPVDVGLLGTTLKDIDELESALTAINARFSVMAIKLLKENLQAKDSSFTYGDLERAYSSLQARVRDELSLVKFLVIGQDRQRYYAQVEPIFGAEVTNKFPSTAFEIDEACKCFALSRSTAAVFHLMRVMEIGVRALARCLAIPDPLRPAERNWGNILKQVLEGIEKKWPTSAQRMHGDGQLFESLYTSLDAVKNPWRNATMHVENKYTDEESEHILVAVRGFMKRLASRMDEEGKPLA